DHLAKGVHQRAARVAGVERRVGLDDVVDQPAARAAQRPTQRADDPRGYRALETVRIADGDGDLPRAYRRRIAQDDGFDTRGLDPQDRKVGAGIVADEIRLEARAVTQRRRQPGGAAHHVAVGQDEPVVGEDEAG